MPRRTRRIFTELDRDQLLLEASLFRQACIAACTKAPVGGPEYLAASQAMAAVDDLAEALTGDRTLFWSKPHSVGASSKH